MFWDGKKDTILNGLKSILNINIISLCTNKSVSCNLFNIFSDKRVLVSIARATWLVPEVSRLVSGECWSAPEYYFRCLLIADPDPRLQWSLGLVTMLMSRCHEGTDLTRCVLAPAPHTRGNDGQPPGGDMWWWSRNNNGTWYRGRVGLTLLWWPREVEVTGVGGSVTQAVVSSSSGSLRATEK